MQDMTGMGVLGMVGCGTSMYVIKLNNNTFNDDSYIIQLTLVLNINSSTVPTSQVRDTMRSGINIPYT